MLLRLILVGLIGSVSGCGGEAGEAGGGFGAAVAGAGGSAAASGAGGMAGSGAGGGAGGLGGGGLGGQPGPEFTSTREWTAAELEYQRALCGCQAPADGISLSACIALASNLPFSDRQDECFDDIILEEEFMTLENRFACLVGVDTDAVTCLQAVEGCDDTEIAGCVSERSTKLMSCPTPQQAVIQLTSACLNTVVEDGVDAFLDSRAARCNCLDSCTPAEPDADVIACMNDTLQAEVNALEPAQRASELECFTDFWRRNAVCFANESSCEGAMTACSDLPAVVCAISGAVLDQCLE